MLTLPLISPLDRLLFLKAHPFFEMEVDIRSLVAIAEHSREVHFSKGASLIEQEQENYSFFLLVEGSVGAYYSGEKRYELKAPGAAGLLPVLAGRLHESSFIALEDIVALEIDIGMFLQVFEDHFDLMLSCSASLANRLANAEAIAGIAPGMPDKPDIAVSSIEGELDLVDRLFQVRRLALFEKANIEILAELFHGDIVRRYEKGEYLCRAGDDPGGFEVLVDGVVRLHNSDQSRSGYIEAIGLVGWRDLITDKPRIWSGVACGPVRTLHVPLDLYTDILEDHTEHALAAIGQLAWRYIEVYSNYDVV
jgi:CRP-like cAMP-binding protein